MELENGDKVPITPTNSPPPELEYPWDKDDDDEMECGICMEDEEEGQLVKTKPIPERPSKEEVEIHNKTHIPYRSWCPHCVREGGQ